MKPSEQRRLSRLGLFSSRVETKRVPSEFLLSRFL